MIEKNRAFSSLILDVLQQIAGLAVQLAAYRLKRRPADGLDVSGFDAREIVFRQPDSVRELFGSHFALNEHHIEMRNDRHEEPPYYHSRTLQ